MSEFHGDEFILLMFMYRRRTGIDLEVPHVSNNELNNCYDECHGGKINGIQRDLIDFLLTSIVFLEVCLHDFNQRVVSEEKERETLFSDCTLSWL